MIELLKDMPAGVAGIRVSGRMSGDDLRDFAPVMQELLGTGEIRIVEVIDSDYEGVRTWRAGRGSETGVRNRPAAPFRLQAHCGGVGQGVGASCLARARVDGSRRAGHLRPR